VRHTFMYDSTVTDCSPRELIAENRLPSGRDSAGFSCAVSGGFSPH
jgi:hypothetical protein